MIRKIKDEQIALNAKGANLKTDGLLGPLTLAARAQYGAPAPGALPPLVTPPPGASDPAVLPGDKTESHLGSFRIALKQALSESAASTAKNRITQLSGLTEGGAAPSVITAAIGLAQSGLRQSQESVFGDMMSGYTEAQKLDRERKTSALSSLNTMIDNDVFLDTPDGALLPLEKEAGLSEGTILAWKARLKIARDKSDEAGELQLKELRQKVADAETPDQPTNAMDIMQAYIDAGVTPEETARKAAVALENIGVQVDQKSLNKLTEQARKLKKTVVPLVATPASVPFTAKGAGRSVSETVTKGVLGVGEFFGAESIKSKTSAVGSFFSGLFGQ